MTGIASAARTKEAAPAWRDLVGLVRLAPGQGAVKGLCTFMTLGVSLLIPVVAARVVDQVLARQDAGRGLAILAAMLVLRSLAEAYGDVAGVSARTGALTVLRH